MAFTVSKNTILLIASVFLLINVPTTSATPFDDVCNKAKNNSFCVNDFGSDPDTKTSTLAQLAKLGIDKAQEQAEAAKFIIAFLTGLQSTDPNLKVILGQCDVSYTDATNALTIALTDLDTQNLRDLSLHGGQASDAGIRCETFFNQQPGNNPLEGPNESIEFLGDIINVAANLLNSLPK